MVFATRGSMAAVKAADTLMMDGALPWFSAWVAGMAEHVEKLARGEHDAPRVAPDELHLVYVPHNHEVGREIEIDHGPEGWRA